VRGTGTSQVHSAEEKCGLLLHVITAKGVTSFVMSYTSNAPTAPLSVRTRD